MECPDYKDCRRKNDLRRKRGRCAKAKDNYVLTNADCIRAMSDELLASQLVVVAKETIKILTDLDVPDEVLTEVRSQILEKLKQPAGGADDGTA